MLRSSVSFLCAVAFLLGVPVAPAEAGKLSKVLARAAATTAARAAARSGSTDDIADSPTTDGQVTIVDPERRAGDARAKLADEAPAGSAAASDSSGGNRLICLAGCN